MSAPFVVYIQANTFPSLCFPCWLTDQIQPDRTPKAASFQSGILVCIIHSCLCYCFFFLQASLNSGSGTANCLLLLNFVPGSLHICKAHRRQSKVVSPSVPPLILCIASALRLPFLPQVPLLLKGYFSLSKNVFARVFFVFTLTHVITAECVCLKTYI